jgi:hypothetical protein
MKSRLLVISLLAIVAIGASNSGEGPALSVDVARMDLGEVMAGRDAVATFTFRNTGAEDVRIIRAKPS